MPPILPGPNHLQLLADRVAQQYGLPPALLRAVVHQESGWNPRAVSPTGAQGLMQLEPGTARGLGVTNPFDPLQNLTGGAKYLKQQISKFGSIPLALAAYNAGPGAVSKYGGIPPYAQTQGYVKNIMAMLKQGGGLPPAAVPAVQGGPPALSPGGGPALGNGGGGLAALLQRATPTDADVGILDKLGGMAGNAARSTQAQLPALQQMVAPQQQQAVQQPSQSPAQQGGSQSPGQEVPMLPVGGALHGQVPMQFSHGAAPPAVYSNLHFASHTDWQHVNPRLLQAVEKVAKKMGLTVEIISGYRSNDYSNRVGGFAGDPHTKGVAIDAYIGGHPIGEVIPPDVWAKLGITSGATPGFYKGKPDPEHLQLTGTPVKRKTR